MTEPENGTRYVTICTIEKCFIDSDPDYRCAPEDATVVLSEVKSYRPAFPQIFWANTLGASFTLTDVTCNIHKKGPAGITMAGSSTSQRRRGPPSMR